MLIFLVLLMAFLPVARQEITAHFNKGSIPVPSVVNFSGMPSTETTALGAQVNNGCATNAYCAQLADASLAGNGIIVFYKYQPATANTADVPTIADDKSNSYTHCGTDANNSTTHFYIGCYYKLNAATGTKAITLTWANANTNVAVATAQFNNVTAADVYATNSGTATTTFTSGSATSTANGDLWFEIACGTTTLTNVGAYTLGSQAGITWAGDMFDRRDACGIQHGIQTSSGALNPQFTGASNSFVALGVSFKAGSAGTAPSGMYVDHLYHVSSASGGTSDLSYQVPALSGDLVAVTNSGGGTGPQLITAVSDGTNGSWTICGISQFTPNPPNQPSSSGYYFPNSAAGVLAVTMTHSGTGDIGPSIFYSIAGAATTQECAYAQLVNNTTATGSTFTVMTGFAPSASSGIWLAATSQINNTDLGAVTGGQDCSIVGGQVINGPSLPDQNNGCTHLSYSSNSPTDIKWTLSATASNAPGFSTTQVMAFQAPAATFYPHVVKSAQNHATTSGTTIAVTSYVPVHAGDTLAVFADANGISTGTVTVSDPTNGTYTAPNAVSNAAGYRSNIFYMKNIAATTVTITATFGTSNSQRSIMIVEVANVSTTAPLDQAAAVTAETAGTGGLVTGPSLTTTAANEFIVAAHLCAGTCDVTNTSFLGYAAQPWTHVQGDAQGNIVTFLATGATGSFTAQAIDSNGSGASDAVAMLTFKQ